MPQCVTVVQATDNRGLDCVCGVFDEHQTTIGVVRLGNNHFDRLRQHGQTTSDGCQAPCPNILIYCDGDFVRECLKFTA